MRTVTCGLIVEGVGRPGTSDATIFAHDYSIDQERPELLSAEVDRGVFVTIPRSVSTEINPIQGSYETSSFTFELLLDDETSALFLRQATIRDSIGVLDSSLEPGADNVFLNVSGHDGEVVYVGDETILLGSFDGDSGGYLNCTRGYHESPELHHPVGRRVYDRIPAWRRRLVELVTFEHQTRQWSSRWFGQIENINTANNGTILQIACRELFAGLSDAEINRSPVDLKTRGAVRAYYDQALGMMQAVGLVTQTTSQVHKLSATHRPAVCRVGDTPMMVPRVGFGMFFNKAEPFGLFGEEAEREGTGPVQEILCVSKSLDQKYGLISATSDLPQPYNPVAIAFALLTSTRRETPDIGDRYDVLHHNFSIDLYPWLDVSAWHKAIEQAQDIEIDQLYMGWDGPVHVLDTIINVLLRPYGFLVSVTQTGKLGIERIVSPDVSHLCAAEQNALEIISPAYGGEELAWETALESTIDQVTAMVGKTPWSDGSSIVIQPGAESERKSAQSDARVFDYDLQTLKRSSVAFYGDGDAGDEATNALISQALQGHYSSPRVSFTTFDSVPDGRTYDLGKYYSIGLGGPISKWFPTKDGTRVTLPSSEDDIAIQFAGMMVSRQFDLLDHTYNIKLLLTAHRIGRIARLRAPNVRVQSSNPGSQTLILESGSLFGHDGHDYDLFREEDDFHLVHENGKLWANSVKRSIANHSGEQWELDGWYASDPGLVEPKLFVRMADADEYSNTAHYECTNRPWTYLANAFNKLSTVDESAVVSEESADVYA